MKESIVMTVSDREPEIMLSTMRWLSLNDLSESEIIVVDDCSEMDYSWLGPYLKKLPTRWVKMEPYECSQINGNYNNPAKAFNRCLEESQGEKLCIISSDVIVPPGALPRARSIQDEGLVYCPMTIDLGSSNEYCGPHRTFPMPWFLYMDRQTAIDAGGWDENYLLGMCFEDNDFMGRVALECKGIVFDWDTICWHQSHFQPAYVEEQWVRAANQRNKQYTLEKWQNGIPFGDADQLSFEINRSRCESSGSLMWTFKDIRGLKESVYAKTLSPFVGVEQSG